MSNDNIDEVFEMVEFNQLENLKKIVNESNVNLFVNEFGQNLLHEAIAQNSREVVHYLLYCNIDVNKEDKEGKTPLHYSAAHNNFEFSKLLLEHQSIQKDKKDRYGNNAMWVAVFYADGYYDVVKLFKKHNLDSNCKNNANRSALDFARQIEDEELVKILLE